MPLNGKKKIFAQKRKLWSAERAPKKGNAGHLTCLANCSVVVAVAVILPLLLLRWRCVAHTEGCRVGERVLQHDTYCHEQSHLLWTTKEALHVGLLYELPTRITLVFRMMIHWPIYRGWSDTHAYPHAKQIKIMVKVNVLAVIQIASGTHCPNQQPAAEAAKDDTR